MLAHTILKPSLPDRIPGRNDRTRPCVADAPSSGRAPMQIESRFGSITIEPDQILETPRGLLGFSEHRAFGLAMLPNGQHPQFRVLQSMSDPNLAFLVAPFNTDSGAISPEDLQDAAKALEIAVERLAVLLIVTVRRDDSGAHVSVNLRAPLFVDTERSIARQLVLPNAAYSIRHRL